MADKDEERPNASPARSNSDNTLEGDRNASDDQHDKQEQEKDDESGEEENGEEAPPKPVGFFDSRLHETRKEVAWKWAVTSECIPATRRWHRANQSQPSASWLSYYLFYRCIGQFSSKWRRTCPP